MKNIEVTLRDGRLEMDAFPNSVCVIQIPKHTSRQLSHLCLHGDDLDFSLACLKELESCESDVAKEALWRSAVIHYTKCFGSNVRRRQLPFEKIFKHAPPGAADAHRYFKDLRNKYFVHDENSFAQALAGAVVNRSGFSPKIAKVVCLALHAETHESDNVSNLKLLLEATIAWVRAEFDVIAEEAQAVLELLPHDELLSSPTVQYIVPGPCDVGKPRVEE